ncbi:hypothetical protein [Candidatus Methylacidithermus pantelleriae]|uniref:Uncharacterized protein n=1 Tax=Candidatus Methylacidithermus pantelleriae TaxID=2744239 RepID=A0A8J2BNJ7_9BACT|nr:hypothetical protein [Candidatus Methylacidithermus pantelleriae]CAF0694021.1 hypothetical protein MPNT_150051 [Candidatus Methylacidithermus pantelleriae]
MGFVISFSVWDLWELTQDLCSQGLLRKASLPIPASSPPKGWPFGGAVDASREKGSFRSGSKARGSYYARL